MGISKYLAANDKFLGPIELTLMALFFLISQLLTFENAPGNIYRDGIFAWYFHPFSSMYIDG